MRRNLQKLLFLLGIAVFIWGCGTSESPDTQDDSTLAEGFDIVESADNDIFYQVPAPEDLFQFVSHGQLAFSDATLNPIENSAKYIDSKSKELNFGIYSADLAYTASFNKYQLAVKYIESLQKLSDEIGISAAFDDALLKRVENIFNNPDTLLDVTNTTYSNFVRYLERADREKTLALISVGGWIESLYIVTHLVEDFEESSVTVQLIADQKLAFENLISYLKKYEADKQIASVLSSLQAVNGVFQSLKIEKLQTKEGNRSFGKNKFIVGGVEKIVMTKEQFEQLKTELAKIRNSITANFNS